MLLESELAQILSRQRLRLTGGLGRNREILLFLLFVRRHNTIFTHLKLLERFSSIRVAKWISTPFKARGTRYFRGQKRLTGEFVRNYTDRRN
jgi:hypothetical protein